jgi:RNA polymerase sigma-70 factor (ECF subfamily)
MNDPAAEDRGRSSVTDDSNVADCSAMVRLRDGEDAALNVLMKRWRKPVLAYLYRMVGDYEVAADLAQEVFVRLYRSRRTYRSNGSFSSFIFTIASNLAKNHFRWKKRHPEAELSDEMVTRIGADPAGVDPQQSLEKSETEVAVRAAVENLPGKLKEAVILFHFNDLTHAEVADILRCSAKTVETRLYRGRKILRERLSSASDF